MNVTKWGYLAGITSYPIFQKISALRNVSNPTDFANLVTKFVVQCLSYNNQFSGSQIIYNGKGNFLGPILSERIPNPFLGQTNLMTRAQRGHNVEDLEKDNH